MELFTATGKLQSVFLTTGDIRCVHTSIRYSSFCHMHDLADRKARIIAAVKNVNAPMLTCVWQELEYRIDVCCATCDAHIEHL
jgi:hypothetical protein